PASRSPSTPSTTASTPSSTRSSRSCRNVACSTRTTKDPPCARTSAPTRNTASTRASPSRPEHDHPTGEAGADGPWPLIYPRALLRYAHHAGRLTTGRHRTHLPRPSSGPAARKPTMKRSFAQFPDVTSGSDQAQHGGPFAPPREDPRMVHAPLATDHGTFRSDEPPQGAAAVSTSAISASPAATTPTASGLVPVLAFSGIVVAVMQTLLVPVIAD